MGLGLREAVECCAPGTLVVHCVRLDYKTSLNASSS